MAAFHVTWCINVAKKESLKSFFYMMYAVFVMLIICTYVAFDSEGCRGYHEDAMQVPRRFRLVWSEDLLAFAGTVSRCRPYTEGQIQRGYRGEPSIAGSLRVSLNSERRRFTQFAPFPPGFAICELRYHDLDLHAFGWPPALLYTSSFCSPTVPRWKRINVDFMQNLFSVL